MTKPTKEQIDGATGEQLAELEVIAKRIVYIPSTGEFKRIGRTSYMGHHRVGHVDRSGYRKISVNNKVYLAHRLAWALYHGEFSNNQIDHINGDKDDNRISNLRCVPFDENMKNRPMQKRNKTGVVGVRERIVGNQKYFYVQIGVNGKEKYLGVFKNIFDAACARRSAELKNEYHENHGRLANRSA